MSVAGEVVVYKAVKKNPNIKSHITSQAIMVMRKFVKR